MTETISFAQRIRERFPEGLTGVFAVGGTRTTYILEQRDTVEEPGSINDFASYADFGLDRLFELIESFFELGGQNLVVALFTYQGFYERGGEYAYRAAQMCLRVLDQVKIDFYRDHQIDPYFAGVDVLLHLPRERFEYELGTKFAAFQREWSYQPGRHKIIFEVSPIPLFSLWRAHQVMGEEAQAELESSLEQCDDLQTMHDLLYKYYSRAVYGADIPTPHFYLGSNRNGDLKLRAALPIALLCGGYFRLYYTPYPSLFITRETLVTILEDVAFGKPLRSTKLDYSGEVTSEVLQAEYDRVQQLRMNPASTIGLVRQINSHDTL